MKKVRSISIRSLSVLVIALLLFIIIKDYWPEIELLANPYHVDPIKLETLVRSHGPKDVILLTILIVVMSAIPGMPVAVICTVTGVCYGPMAGFVINWIGNILGNALSSLFLGQCHSYPHNKQIQRLVKNNHPQVMMIIGYALPFIPSVGLNYSAAIQHIPKQRHLLLIAIGVIPPALLYALGGNAILKVKWKQLIAITIIIVVLVVISFLLTIPIKRHQHS